MLTIKAWLFVAIGVVTVFFIWTWFSLIRRRQSRGRTAPQPLDLGIGFVTNFFDTLGIGSFATTTSTYKLLKRVRDEDIPGTLNVGHTVPVITQAFIYIAIVEVDMTTLISLISASVLGMWFGAGVVSKLPRRPIQIGMGIALLVAAALTLMTIYNKQASGGEALGLTGVSLVIAIIGNFILGSLLALGIGSYGPSLIMISLLGMNPIAAFPIMMGSAAFMMPTGSTRFIVKERYNLRAALGLALGGIPAVLLAAYIVRSLNLYYVRWLVVIVVVYAALTLLRSAWVERRLIRVQEAEA
jgi:uncharacterized membrane protein YfcA